MEEFLKQSLEHLLGRLSGPMWIRFVLQPLVSVVLGLRAGARDARLNRAPFGSAVWSGHVPRGILWRQVWRGIARLFTFAAIIDVIYQVFFLHEFHPLQALLVATALAILPYLLVRGPANRLIRMRQNQKKKVAAQGQSTVLPPASRT
jgi:hypothetical protein